MTEFAVCLSRLCLAIERVDGSAETEFQQLADVALGQDAGGGVVVLQAADEGDDDIGQSDIAPGVAHVQPGHQATCQQIDVREPLSQVLAEEDPHLVGSV